MPNNEKKCCICGKVIAPGTGYFETDDKMVCCSSECHGAKYWLERVANKSSERQIIVNGECYQIGDERSAFRGYDGALFIIRKLNADNTIIETRNLWHNGTVPKAFRELLPDNAMFIKPDDLCRSCGKYYEDCECSDIGEPYGN